MKNTCSSSDYLIIKCYGCHFQMTNYYRSMLNGLFSNFCVCVKVASFTKSSESARKNELKKQEQLSHLKVILSCFKSDNIVFIFMKKHL